MFDGLLPETCAVRAENIVRNASGYGAIEYDLVEYGCSGEVTYEVDRRHIDQVMDVGFVMLVDDIEHTLAQVNRVLRQRSGCDCVR